ncbi:hypothetical protein AAIG39_23335 [Phytobacter palmae]|uniref:Uncharacterized protein n=1 Tax=Phytobacter palmae TaxID=1855371 RepID=A0ABU9VB52_9ENTR
MLKRQIAETVLIEMARLQGHALNGQEQLIIRTRLNSALSAKERHRQRMTTPEYHWRKPSPRR